ncbi:hypothetical protein EE612_003214, partial [Oryza sativa]
RDALAHTLGSRRLPEGVADAGERVPDAVAPGVMPFIRAADKVEQDSPRVAFLCKRSPLTHTLMDPSSVQRGVRQFKTYMSVKLDQVCLKLTTPKLWAMMQRKFNDFIRVIVLS